MLNRFRTRGSIHNDIHVACAADSACCRRWARRQAGGGGEGRRRADRTRRKVARDRLETQSVGGSKGGGRQRKADPVVGDGRASARLYLKQRSRGPCARLCR